MSLDDFKKKYPQYDNWDDQDLANALYEKHGESAGVSKDQFMVDIGRDNYSSFAPARDEAAVRRAGDSSIKEQQKVDTPTKLDQEYSSTYASLKEGGKDIIRSHFTFMGGAQAAIEPGKEVKRIEDVQSGRVPYVVQSLLTPGAVEEYGKARSAGMDPAKTMIVQQQDRVNMYLDSAAKWAADPNYNPGTGLRKFYHDVVRMTPQLASQVGLAVLTGTASSALYMGTQIAGGHMEQLSQEGVKDPVVRFKAAMFNAAAQTPMEQLALGKMLDVWKPSKHAAEVIKRIMISRGTEFSTEALQKLPELMATTWAKGETEGWDFSTRMNRFWEGLPQAAKEGAYEGLVAAVAGAPVDLAATKYKKDTPDEDPKAAVEEYNKQLDEWDNSDLDPRLIQEMEQRKLFGEQQETPGGPRTAPVRTEQTEAAAEEAVISEEEEQTDEDYELDDDVDEAETTGLTEDVPQIQEEEIESDVDEVTSLQEEEQRIRDQRLKMGLDPLVDDRTPVQDQNGNGTYVTNKQLKPGVVAIDVASSDDPDPYILLEELANKRDKDGNRSWRFGFILDALEELGAPVRVVVTNEDHSQLVKGQGPSSAAMYVLGSRETRGAHVIAINERNQMNRDGNLNHHAESLAHELLHAMMDAKRAGMTRDQQAAYYSDLGSAIANVNMNDIDNVINKAIAIPETSVAGRNHRNDIARFTNVLRGIRDGINKGKRDTIFPHFEELITYAFTNPNIAKAMSEIRVKSNVKGVKSMWDAFIHKVAATLGIKKGSLLREVERIMSKHAGIPPKTLTTQKPKTTKKGYTFKSVDKDFADEVNAIIEDYPEVLEDTKKLHRLITTGQRVRKREATPNRKRVDGEAELMQELGPDEFAKRRYRINDKGKKVRWYTDNDIKNFNEFMDLAREFMENHPDFETDLRQAVDLFVKPDTNRLMPKGYTTSIVDGQVIDHPVGWVSKPAKSPTPASKPKAKPKATPKKEKPKKAPKKPKKEAKPDHPFPTKPGVVTIERGSKDGKMAKREYEVGYHFAIGEGTGLAKHFGNVTTYTKKITPGKFVIMDDPNTWDNWDSMLDTFAASKGKYGEANDVKLDRLIDALEHNRGEGASNYNDDDMEKVFRALGLDGAFYNAIAEEGGGGPAIMFVDKPKVNKKKAPKKSASGQTKKEVKSGLAKHPDIFKHAADTKWLESEWGRLATARIDAKNDPQLMQDIDERIKLIKDILMGGTKLSVAGGLSTEFISATEKTMNDIMPGYDFKLEGYYPKSSGFMPHGFYFHVANPNSVLYRASFTHVADTIDPEVFRQQVSEREQIFQQARDGKPQIVNMTTAHNAKYSDPQMEKDHTDYRVGVKKDTYLQRIGGFLVAMKNKFREFENISRKKLGQYAEATKELRRLRNYRGIASTKAVAKLGKILNGMTQAQYDVFERLVTMADFYEQHKINEQRVRNGEGPLDVPFDWPEDAVNKEFNKLVRMAMADPTLKAAWSARLDTWDELKSEYGTAMNDVGFDVQKRMQRTLYFRHQVVDYLKAKGPSTISTKKLATPANRSHLRARKGTIRPINLNYIQAEYEVMAQLLYDIQIAKTIKTIKDNFDIKDKLKEEQGEQELENYEIPEGYVAWRPREGSVMYLADTIPSKLVEQAIAKQLKTLKVKTKDISKVLVVGRKHAEMVIPEDLADTLNNYLDTPKKGPVGRFFRSLMTGWKAWQLVSPFRVVKYNIRNMTGDAEAVFVGGQTLATGKQMFTKAGSDILRKLVGLEPSSEYTQWVDRGGLESNFTTQEMADILRSPEFNSVTGRGSKLKAFLYGMVKTPRKLTDAREQWMRYASYLAYMKKLEAGTFKASDYAASIPQEVDNLRDNRDKAFMLSNDLLGAYDRVTEAGDFMRRHVMPFYSFQEVNASRTAQIFRNMIANDRLAGSIARKILGKVAAKSVTMSMGAGRLALTLLFWSTMLQVYNNLEYPEEEAAMPDDLRETPHIYMGPSGSKQVRYFPRVGILGDLLEWGNLQSAPMKLGDFLTGRTSWDTIRKDMEKLTTIDGVTDAAGAVTEQFAKKVTGMLGPQYKVPFELVTQQKLFPDATNPKPITDWRAHVADQMLPKEVGNLIRERPMAKTWRSDMVESLYTYKQDLTKMAYNATKARKIDWLKSMGLRGRGYHSSEKATAAYNMSLAFRYGDTAALAKYYVDYVKLSYGQVKDIGKMMEALDPLYGMTETQQLAFVASLDKNEMKGLVLAYKHYAELRSGVQFKKGK